MLHLETGFTVHVYIYDVESQYGVVLEFTIPKFTIIISQSGAVATILTSCGIKSLLRYGYNIMVSWLYLGTVNI